MSISNLKSSQSLQSSTCRLDIKDKLQDLQSYFQQIKFAFNTRKLQVDHILKKAESVLSDSSKEKLKLKNKLELLEQKVSNQLRQSKEDMDQTTEELNQFIEQQLHFFNEVCKSQCIEESQLSKLLYQTSKKRRLQLKGLIAKQRLEATQGTIIERLRCTLRQKCANLDKDLIAIKQNTSKCKKQTDRQIKVMFRMLEQIQQHRADRESKEECIIALIDRMGQEGKENKQIQQVDRQQ